MEEGIDTTNRYIDIGGSAGEYRRAEEGGSVGAYRSGGIGKKKSNQEILDGILNRQREEERRR